MKAVRYDIGCATFRQCIERRAIRDRHPRDGIARVAPA